MTTKTEYDGVVTMTMVKEWVSGLNIPRFYPDKETAVEAFTDGGRVKPARVSFVCDAITAPNVVPFHSSNPGVIRVVWHFGSGYDACNESRDYRIVS